MFIGQALRRFWKPVDCTSLSRLLPVSQVFGTDRGAAIDRHYIGKFLSRNAHLIKGRGGEISELLYSVQFGEKLISRDIFDLPSNPLATIHGDLVKIDSLPDSIFDVFIATQTFNFIYDLDSAIKGAYKMLRPEGVLIATVSGICQISRYDMARWGDYWRFTSLSAKKKFEEVFGEGNIEIHSYGNVSASVALLQGLSIQDLPTVSVLDFNDQNYEIIIGIVATKR